MAIYRPPRPRWPAITGALVLGLVIGIATGWVMRGSGDDPTEAARTVRTQMTAAAGLLEVAEIEYSEAVGGSSVIEAELSGAKDAVARSRDLYATVSGALDMLDPEGAEAIRAAYAKVGSLMDSVADPPQVTEALGALSDLLT